MSDIQVSVSQYPAEKAAGTVKIIKLNGQPFYSKRGFDPATGEPTPTNVPLNLAQLQEVSARLKADAAAFDELISDIQAAQEVAAPAAGGTAA